MADPNSKNNANLMKMYFWEFSGSLITNPWSDFRNTRWRIQYDN